MKEKRVDCGQLLSARWGGDQEQRKVHSHSESSGEAPRLIRMPSVISPSRIGLAQSRPASLNFCIDSWPCLQRSSSSLIHHPIFTLLSNDHFPTFTHGIAGLREHLQAAHFRFLSLSHFIFFFFTWLRLSRAFSHADCHFTLRHASSDHLGQDGGQEETCHQHCRGLGATKQKAGRQRQQQVER